MEKTIKKELLERFNTHYKQQGMRLLAIQLNGFSHKLFYDRGSKNNRIEIVEYSNYAGDSEKTTLRGYEIGAIMFRDIPHYSYQGAPREIIYLMPNKR